MFVHSDVRLRAVRETVMAVTLEGNFEDEHGVSMESLFCLIRVDR